MTLYKGRYRVESPRYTGWDYAASGWYFITICTVNRRRWFGRIIDGVMHLSPIGEIVHEEWAHTAAIRPLVALDAWVVMPDHLHGIIVIHNTNHSTPPPHVETPRWGVSMATDTDVDVATDADNDGGIIGGRTGVQLETPHRGVSTGDNTTREGGNTTGGDPPPSRSRLYPNSIGAIITQFKSVCTRRIRAQGTVGFAWQPRFHDRVIRDERELDAVRRYVLENPVRWRKGG